MIGWKSGGLKPGHPIDPRVEGYRSCRLNRGIKSPDRDERKMEMSENVFRCERLGLHITDCHLHTNARGDVFTGRDYEIVRLLSGPRAGRLAMIVWKDVPKDYPEHHQDMEFVDIPLVAGPCPILKNVQFSGTP